MNESGIIKGFKISTQNPLDGALRVLLLTDLTDYGTNNQKAYTYYEDMIIYCVQTKKNYIWKEKEATDTAVSAEFTYPSSTVVDGITYSSRIFYFVQVADNDLDQDNIRKFVIVDTPAPGGSIVNAINGTDISDIDKTADLPSYLTVTEKQLITFKVPFTQEIGNSVEVYYEYYNLIGSGKGKYCLGGDITLTADNLMFVKTTEVATLTSDKVGTPTVYIIHTDETTAVAAINASSTAYTITETIDFYFKIVFVDTSIELYRFVGATGIYGNGVGSTDTVITTDLLQVDSNENLQQITSRSIFAGIIDDAASDDISQCLNRSVRTTIYIKKTEMVYFEAMRHVTQPDDSVIVTRELYAWNKGEAKINQDSVLTDFIIIDTTHVTVLDPDSKAVPEFKDVYGVDYDIPEDVLNDSTETFIVDSAVKDTYFTMLKNDVTSEDNVVYKFIGAAGTYGDGGTSTAVNGDFSLHVAVEPDTHQHLNKTLLDTYTQTEADLASAIADDHTHANNALLDTYTQTEADIASAIADDHTHANNALLDTYTQTEADLASAVADDHSHANNALLDTYTQTNADIADAVTDTHAHANKTLLDTYTQTEVDIASVIAEEHTHSNKALLDTYTQTDADLITAISDVDNLKTVRDITGEHKVTITTAQLLTLQATPVAILSSLGAGTFPDISDVYLKFVDGGTSYAGTGDIQIYMGALTDVLFETNLTMITGGVDTFVKMSKVNAKTPTASNIGGTVPIYIKSTGVITLGDGEVTLYFTVKKVTI